MLGECVKEVAMKNEIFTKRTLLGSICFSVFNGHTEGLFIQSAISELGGIANMSDGQVRIIKNENSPEDGQEL